MDNNHLHVGYTATTLDSSTSTHTPFSILEIMASHAPRVRSLYRNILRELPARSPSILANPSPIQKHIRADISNSTATPSLQHQQEHKTIEQRLDEASQYVNYLRAQRQYTTLVERYNPGMNMNEEERVRLSARRVGMNLPVEADLSEEEGGEDGKAS
jgi:hypothetical protein